MPQNTSNIRSTDRAIAAKVRENLERARQRVLSLERDFAVANAELAILKEIKDLAGKEKVSA